jgi:hypothetical protein
MKEYGLHPEAEANLDSIWESIAEDSIDATIHAVVSFPDRGHHRRDLTARPLRYTNSGNYCDFDRQRVIRGSPALIPQSLGRPSARARNRRPGVRHSCAI